MCYNVKRLYIIMHIDFFLFLKEYDANLYIRLHISDDINNPLNFVHK